MFVTPNRIPSVILASTPYNHNHNMPYSRVLMLIDVNDSCNEDVMLFLSFLPLAHSPPF
jgi:hypothetical protein